MVFRFLRRIRLTAMSPLPRSSPGHFASRDISPRPMFAWTVERKPAGIPPTTIPLVSQLQAMIPFSTGTHHQNNAANLKDHHQKEQVKKLDDSKEETFWELRFTIHYEYIEGKQYIKSITIHGLWRNKLVDGKKVPVNNVGDYKIDMPRAQELLDDLKTDHPDVVEKMKKFWKSTNHTRNQEEFWKSELLKHHDSLDYSYWIKAMEIADSYFDEEGTCTFLKYMEEKEYENGTYSCNEFRRGISDKHGKEVLVTFEYKASGRLYPMEFSVFMDSSYNKIHNPDLQKYEDQTFYLDERHPGCCSVKDRLPET